MSGMFYSIEEAAEKLSKSKDEVKKLVKDGQLREFRDGPNILFKVEEIEALIPEVDISGLSEIEEPVNTKDETEIIELAPEESEVTEEMEIPEFTLEESERQAIEEEMEIPELAPEEPNEAVIDEEPLLLEPEPEEKSAEHDDFIDFNADTAISEIPEEPAESKVELTDDSFADFSINSETGAPADNNDINDLTDGDTDLVGQGTSILGLTDNKEYELTDDTMADTVILDGTKGGSTGLEEIEEDVSLDSFGSGSGLLDLSLQADDTSLGGILDEIYTDDNKEPGLSEQQEPGIGAGMDAEQETPAGIGDEALTPQLNSPAMAFGVGTVELPPDSQSNILGILLFLPIVAVLYAVIVTLGGLRGIVPSILTIVQDYIWFIMGGLAVITAAIAAAAFMLTGERTPRVKKEKPVKIKKEKAPKVKKEKAPKVKKEKPPKPDKKAKKK